MRRRERAHGHRRVPAAMPRAVGESEGCVHRRTQQTHMRPHGRAETEPGAAAASRLSRTDLGVSPLHSALSPSINAYHFSDKRASRFLTTKAD